MKIYNDIQPIHNISNKNKPVQDNAEDNKVNFQDILEESVQKNISDEAAHKAFKQLELLFVKKMLSQVSFTGEKEASAMNGIIEDTFVEEMSKLIVQGKGIGLAENIMENMSKTPERK